jgi:hypothetical protein
VNASRALIFAILLYVALDFFLPTMPGAFVFDPAESVESVHVKRDALSTIAVRSAVVPDPFVVTDSRVDVSRIMQISRATVLISDLDARNLPRAALSPPPPTEDPH